MCRSKPMLQQDNIGVVSLASWEISLDQFGIPSGLFGPIPILFADDPEGVRPKIEAAQDQIFRQLNKLNMRYGETV